MQGGAEGREVTEKTVTAHPGKAAPENPPGGRGSTPSLRGARLHTVRFPSQEGPSGERVVGGGSEDSKGGAEEAPAADRRHHLGSRTSGATRLRAATPAPLGRASRAGTAGCPPQPHESATGCISHWLVSSQGPEIQIICESGTARRPLPPGTWPQRSRLLLGSTDLTSQTRKEVGKSRTQTLS